MTLTDKEAKIAAALLSMAAHKFSRHGCNDFRLGDHVEMSDDEKRALDLAVHKQVGDPRDHEPDQDHDWQQDFCLMFYFASRLRGEA